MKTTLNILLCVVMLCASSCYQPHDERVNLQQGLRSDSLGSNIIVRPVGQAWSALIGESIEVNRVTSWTNRDGFMELEVRGYNQSHDVRRFLYRVEWLDSNGVVIGSKATAWLQNSSMGKSPFTIRAVAPTTTAVDFRINTRKIKN